MDVLAEAGVRRILGVSTALPTRFDPLKSGLIQFLLGDTPVPTTECYLGYKQNLEEPVNDRRGCLLSKTPDLR